MITAESEFLRYSVAKLRQECGKIEACIAKLTPEQIWRRGGEAQNAAGNLLLHLTGNLRQWILAGVAGRPIARDRDAEFAARGGAAPHELIDALRAALEDVAAVLESLPPARLTESLVIQGHTVSVLEAVYHVVEHFSYHAGQIVLLTKSYTDTDLGFYGYLNRPGGAAGRKP